MRYFLDCEFIEDGRTIDLISIGIVAEDGRESGVGFKVGSRRSQTFGAFTKGAKPEVAALAQQGAGTSGAVVMIDHQRVGNLKANSATPFLGHTSFFVLVYGDSVAIPEFLCLRPRPAFTDDLVPPIALPSIHFFREGLLMNQHPVSVARYADKTFAGGRPRPSTLRTNQARCSRHSNSLHNTIIQYGEA